MLKKKIQELLQRPMTRREFLRNIGLLAIGLLGLNNILHVLGDDTRVVHHYHHPIAIPDARGFGGGKFGV